MQESTHTFEDEVFPILKYRCQKCEEVITVFAKAMFFKKGQIDTCQYCGSTTLLTERK